MELQCSTILFNSAITACGRCAQWATALAIFTDHFTESLEKCPVVIQVAFHEILWASGRKVHGASTGALKTLGVAIHTCVAAVAECG